MSLIHPSEDTIEDNSDRKSPSQQTYNSWSLSMKICIHIRMIIDQFKVLFSCLMVFSMHTSFKYPNIPNCRKCKSKTYDVLFVNYCKQKYKIREGSRDNQFSSFVLSFSRNICKGQPFITKNCRTFHNMQCQIKALFKQVSS